MSSDRSKYLKCGAYTKQPDIDDHYKVIKNVVSCDYASQYPNTIIQFNMGSETFRGYGHEEKDEYHSIDIYAHISEDRARTVEDLPRFVYF